MKLRKSFRKFIAPAMLPVALALAALQPGCLFGSPGPSAVGQGQEYRSGDATFDEFFAKLHELSVDLAKAPQEEKEHRIALAKELGMELEEEAPPAASPPTTAEQPGQSAMSAVPGLNQLQQIKTQVDAAKQQAGQLSSLASGVGAATPQSPEANSAAAPRKKLAPSASLLARTIAKRTESLNVQLSLAVDTQALGNHEVETELRSAPGALEGDGRKLANALHDAARAELRLYVRMKKARRELDKLAALAVALDASVDGTFRKGGASKKAEVRKNLEDARAFIELMQKRADEVAGKADDVVDELLGVASAKLEPAPTDGDKPETVAKEERVPAAPRQTKSGATAAAPRAQTPTVADFEP